MSEMMRSSPSAPARSQRRPDKHGGGRQRRGAGLEDGSHGVLPGDPVTMFSVSLFETWFLILKS
jgi:hypothetical protein